MKILLICGAGASSGFMAQAMRRAAKAQGIELTVLARSEGELRDNLDGTNIVLIGPHLAYKEPAIKAVLDSHGIPHMIIPEDIYGSLDGEELLELALEAIEGK